MPRKRKTTPPLTPNKQLVANAAYNQVNSFFTQGDQKHSNNYDFGYPNSITFSMYYSMYKRNGFAKAGIEHTTTKTWRDYPWLQEGEDPKPTPTTKEKAVSEMIERTSLWQRMYEVDKRSRVGEYGALVFRFADGKRNSEPVERLAGPDSLIEVIPCYQAQLEPSAWDTDETSPTYGQPTMYQFNEARIGDARQQPRSFTVHPDRVHIWSEDGSINCTPILEAGFNDLLTIQKIIGSGGEGFWKNAKSAPVFNTSPEANLQTLATMLGTNIEGIADALDAVVAGWQKGFDQVLMLQGIEAKTLGVTLPQPAEFIAAPLQSFAASINEPLKILVGSQSGERASTEDAKEFDSTIMARRENMVKPNIMRVLDKLLKLNVIPSAPWTIQWTDLTEDSSEEKLAKAKEMATINKELVGTGERAFTADEIREAAGFEPSGDNELLPEDDSEGDTEA